MKPDIRPDTGYEKSLISSTCLFSAPTESYRISTSDGWVDNTLVSTVNDDRFRFAGGGSGMFGGHSSFTPPPPAAPPVKSDQPMVTIKRVMRSDSSQPTVTISVKKEEKNAMDKEKVLFTLVNGQVLKTNHAPENLIPSAKPLPRDLAMQILPDDMQDAALSKKQKRKNKKVGAGVTPTEVVGSEQPPQQARTLLPQQSRPLPPQRLPQTLQQGDQQNRVPMTPQGKKPLYYVVAHHPSIYS